MGEGQERETENEHTKYLREQLDETEKERLAGMQIREIRRGRSRQRREEEKHGRPYREHRRRR